MFLDTIKSYLAIKRNEVLIHATTWMNFEHIMLSERSQATPKKRSHIVGFCLYEISRIGKPIETERSFVVAVDSGSRVRK